MSGCCGGIGAGAVIGGSSAEVGAGIEWLPRPEIAYGTSVDVLAGTTFAGGSYTMIKPFTFNRIQLRVGTLTGTPTGRVLIYQDPNGEVQASTNLIATGDFTPVGSNTNIDVVVTEGLVTAVPGILWILTGERTNGGSFTISRFNNGGVNLYTANVNVGNHPTNFGTSISATTAPATFDPLEGGADGVSQSSGDTVAVIRLLRV